MIERWGKNMNDLLATGEWIDVERPPAKHSFSYNACAHATLSEDGYGQLRFNLGHAGAGVAFSTAFGDGIYPVLAHYHKDGTLRSVEVVFQNDEDEEEWNDDIED